MHWLWITFKWALHNSSLCEIIYLTKVTAIQVALSKKEYKQLNINIMKNLLLILVVMFAFIMNSANAQGNMDLASVDVSKKIYTKYNKSYTNSEKIAQNKALMEVLDNYLNSTWNRDGISIRFDKPIHKNINFLEFSFNYVTKSGKTYFCSYSRDLRKPATKKDVVYSLLK